MQIEIHDVEHGGCIVITGPLGDLLMLDCGINLAIPWFPSISYKNRTIQTLMFLNLDEDHVEDLPELCRNVQINGIFTNPTVTAAALKSMKPDGMHSGVQMAHNILARFGSGRIGHWDHALGGVRWQTFWNVYNRDFNDTNNLSLAVFVSYSGFTILFGGDMECAGWEKLLQNPYFVARLPEVRVYVASHHGRESGQCAGLFSHMRPDVVIFSDGPKVHGTQETTGWYSARVKGIIDTTKSATSLSPVWRKVMTTRKDGTLQIKVRENGSYTILYPMREPTTGELSASPLSYQPSCFSTILNPSKRLLGF